MEVLPIAPEPCLPLKGRVSPLTNISLNHAAGMISGKVPSPLDISQPRVPRQRLPLSSRLFAPLSPIIASPRCTPSNSTSSAIETCPTDEEDKILNSVLRESPVSEETFNFQDVSPTPLPTWTSTPPTPPAPLSRGSLEACILPSHQKRAEVVSPSVSDPAFTSISEAAALRHLRRASAPPVSFAKFSPLTTFEDRPSRLSIALTGRILSGTTTAAAGASSQHVTPMQLSHPKPIFHIPPDASDNEDENLHIRAQNTEEMSCPLEKNTDQLSSPPGATRSDRELATRKDAVRRYHVLMELLTTEVGYLFDLRVLVTIYIHQLSLLANGSSAVAPSPAPCPHAANLVPTAPAVANATSPTRSTLPAPWCPQDAYATPAERTETTGSKGKRHLLSEAELGLVTRNAAQILQLHEHFVDDLREAVSPLSFPTVPEEFQGAQEVEWTPVDSEVPPTEAIDEAIRIVSTKFAIEASRFNLYQDFCSSHSAALTLIHKIQQQYPSEWEAYEQRASALVLELLQPSRIGATTDPTESSPSLLGPSVARQRRGHSKRSHSLSSLEVNTSYGSSLQGSATTGPVRKPNGSRLGFMGYLIKPIQRICKYPLLLEQLKAKASTGEHSSIDCSQCSSDASRPWMKGPDGNVVVESATQAMMHVTALVDEAGRRQTMSMQSSLIASRIHLAWASSHSSLVHRAFHLLTPNFVASLGACVLAGPLDVMHYHSTKALSVSAKPKYFGAFLYMGGYFILVKVGKGKVYEPRHWFSLSGFDLTDLHDEDAKLPNSFLLSCNGHHLILGSSCHREKEVWISSINRSLSIPPPWTNEPTSSLHFEVNREALLSNVDDTLSEKTSSILPTIHSVPDVEESSSTAVSPQGSLAPIETPTTPTTPTRSESASCRRSSSVKSIFAPLSLDTSRRSSLATHALVDRGLEDVISEPCRLVRSHASAHDLDSVYVSKQTRSGFGRSNSGLSLSKLGRRESLLVPRKKTAEGIPKSADPQLEGISSTSTLRPKALSLSRRRKRIAIPAPLASYSEGDDTNDPGPESPKPVSLSSSNRSSTSTSSVNDAAVATEPVTPVVTVADGTQGRPKRARSMVENVRGLFHTRAGSESSSILDPTSPITTNTPTRDGHDLYEEPRDENAMLNGGPGLLKWWSKGSLRRRARSSPDVPAEDLKPDTLTAQLHTPEQSVRGILTEPSSRKLHRNFSLLQRFSPFMDP